MGTNQMGLVNFYEWNQEVDYKLDMDSTGGTLLKIQFQIVNDEENQNIYFKVSDAQFGCFSIVHTYHLRVNSIKLTLSISRMNN